MLVVFCIITSGCLQGVEESWCWPIHPGAQCGRCSRATREGNRSASWTALIFFFLNQISLKTAVTWKEHVMSLRPLSLDEICRGTAVRETSQYVGQSSESCVWFEQVALWQTWMGTDSWTCCWHMERVPSSQSLSSRSHRCVCVSARVCVFVHEIQALAPQPNLSSCVVRDRPITGWGSSPALSLAPLPVAPKLQPSPIRVELRHTSLMEALDTCVRWSLLPTLVWVTTF